MEALAELERLSLVAQVSSEISNFLGVGDKTLAEYVISQRKKAKSVDDFKKTFKGQMPDSLLDSIDRLIQTLDPPKNSSATNGKDKSTSNGHNAKLDGIKELEALMPKPDMNKGANVAQKQDEGRKPRPGFQDRYDDRHRSNRDSYRSEDRRNDYPSSNRGPRGRDDGYQRGGRDFEDRRRGRDKYRDQPNGRGTYQDRFSPDRVPIVEEGKIGKRKKRLTSPERFEIQQLIASGAASAKDFPDYDPTEALNEGEPMGLEEDVDIELAETEPAFLAGQTKQALELSPIRVVKAPDGSMNRAALNSEAVARERRDLRQQEARDRAEEQASKADINAQWLDPMANPEDRQFASDAHGQRPGRAAPAVPKWKQRQEYGKKTNLSMAEQRRSLPVFALRQPFLNAVDEHNVLVTVGETGSGKTTQLPQYLAEVGYGASTGKMIGVTQPRRVAAISVAKRVSEEVGCTLGAEVGYTIRFEDNTSRETRLKYMTDGILLRECLLDPALSRYQVIMLDEAHERTIATDVLFGLLKKALKRRPDDLKVIVMSATLDSERFSEYFNKCPVFTIPGRSHPVEILYAREPVDDYNEEAITTAMQIHLTEPPGDILIFLTGREEIESACEILDERMKSLGPSVPELIILPIYSALPTEMQSQVFEPAPVGSRKVVIATNIAETSLTIDGIIYVIDPGYSKVQIWDSKLSVSRLQVTPISQAQAKQRAGRAGRTAPGRAYRLYTENAFRSEMTPVPVPEIQRENLSSTALTLKAMGINDLLTFDLIDKPNTGSLLASLEYLYNLGALDDEGLLTRLGRQMADVPGDVGLAKTLIVSARLNCSAEVLSISALLSSQGELWHRPRGPEQQKADARKARFNDPTGDHVSLLNAYNAWVRNDCDIGWARENYLQQRTLKRARDIRGQLVDIFKRHRLPIVSCGRDTKPILRAFCAGFFRNTARKDSQEGNYKTLVEATPVHMHPSSALFGKGNADHLIYQGVVETSKTYMHICSAIDPRLLVEMAPTFFKVAPSDRLSKRRKAERIQPLATRGGGGDDDWRLSAQRRQGRGGGGGTWG